MNKQLSQRETRLLIALPAVIIICIYAFFYERPHRAAVDRLQLIADVARKNPVSDAQLRARKNEALVLNEQVKLEQRRAATHSVSKLPARWTSPAGRLEALAAIGSAFDAHGLVVVSTSQKTDTNAMAPKPLQEFAAAVAQEGKSPVPEVWRVEVLGSYADLLATLKQLGHAKGFIIPLGVSMESIGDDTSYRHWSVWFWV